MNRRKIQDLIYLGMGRSARLVGHTADAFRRAGSDHPLDPRNRFLRLPAAFLPARGKDTTTNTFGDVLWHGTFDASYTRPGDYLVTDTKIFFVASQEPMLPVLCVRTNRTISIAQPSMQTSIARNAYGGYTTGNSITLMDRWPASVLGESKSSSSPAHLPTDTPTSYWNVLVPSPVGVILSPGNIITDDLRRTATIVGSELTNLGWRISAKMAST
jgi:hypothetical protein